MNYRALIIVGALVGSIIQPVRSQTIPSTASTLRDADEVDQQTADRFVTENDSRRLEFSAEGLRYVPRSNSMPMSLVGLTYTMAGIISRDGQHITDIGTGAVLPVSQGSDVIYRRPTVMETYRPTESGVEQLLLFEHNPSPAGDDVVVTGEVVSDLEPESPLLETLTDMVFFAQGKASLRYTAATVRDAGGREAIAPLHFERNRASIILDGKWLNEAAYPVVVSSSIDVTPATSLMRPLTRTQGKEKVSSSLVAATAVPGVVTAASDTAPIWRLQLQMVTNDVSDAGTNDSVSVGLNDLNVTWLDYGRNDFERNSAFTYDLVPDNVARLGDIRYLKVSKTGSNGLNLRSLTLAVNGRNIYSLDFGPGGRWLDNDGSHTTSFQLASSTLRTHPLWSTYTTPFPPFVFPRAELESRVEAIIGDFINDNSLYWGEFYSPRWVEAARKDATAVHFDLDLAADVPYLPDPPVDIDFDFRLTCTGGVFGVTVNNFQYSTSLWGDVLLFVGRISGLFTPKTIPPITYTLGTGQPFCPRVNVESDGAISLSL